MPILRCRDPQSATTWLCRVLGFRSNVVAEEDGNVVHAQLRRGNSGATGNGVFELVCGGEDVTSGRLAFGVKGDC